MLDARNALRRRRGREPLDVEAELRALTRPAIDPGIEAEIRELVSRATTAARAAASRRSTSRRRSRGRSARWAATPADAVRPPGGARAPVRVQRDPMPAPRRFDLEDILNRPGTYFNPETEVLLVVDDAPELDADLFEDDSDGGEWVLLGDDVPLDERARDEVIERFEVRHHPGATSAPAEDDEEEEEEELEPDEEQPEL